MEVFLHGYRDRSEAELGWLGEVFQRVSELLLPVATTPGETAGRLTAAVVTRVEQLAPCSLSLPLSYRLVSISELVSRQRTACCSNQSWSTNQHREWVRAVVLPNHRALPRANLLLIGCLTAGHGSGRPCDGSWRVKDASGSLHCELLCPSPLWLGPPMIFPCWNYIPHHAAGQHQGEAGYLELIGSPLPLTSHPEPGLALDSGGAELCNAVGVREASALLQH
ncbi:CST complex subunit CTC1, partial [Osmerus eperlanus]|uniref:CST complex subunit CTC1 n=1 Tax=Osmerus eperlanus TaxID=29151 RepID=UPI002E116DC0